MFNDRSQCVDCTIVKYSLGWVRVVGQEEMPPCSTAGSGGTEVGSITVYIQDHVTGEVSDRGIGMGGTIVQQCLTGFGRGFCAFRLCGS